VEFGEELLESELRYLDIEYLDRTPEQFPKKAVAFFDTNKWEHQKFIGNKCFAKTFLFNNL